MSQHDFNIANQTFPNFRADLNNALVAAATMSAGSSAPTTPYAYQLWFDTTTGTWKVRNSGNTAWISTITTDLATGNLDVTGTVTASGDVIRNDTTTGTSKFALQYSGSDAAVFKRNNSTGVATIANGYAGAPVDAINISLAGNVGIGCTPSTVLDVEGSNINFASSENGILNVFSNDAAATDKGGSISLGGNSDSGALGFALIKGAKEGTDSGYLAFGTRTAAAYSTERMRITGSGAVIINNSGGDAQLYMGGDSGTNRMYLARSGANSSLWNASNGAMIFGTNNAEKMRLDSSGKLTISSYGTGNHDKWDFNGSYGASSNIAVAGNSTRLSLQAAGVQIGAIFCSASATSFLTSSDYRLKTAVTYDWDATSRLKQLKPARFAWIADGDDAVPVDGFLAHEVQTVVPEAITGEKDGMRDEEYTVSAATGDIYTPAVEATYDEDGVELTAAVDEVIHSADVERPEELAESQQWRETTAAVMGTRSVPDYQGIDQSKLTPLLTKALIEAVEKIEQLEARISALEAS